MARWIPVTLLAVIALGFSSLAHGSAVLAQSQVQGPSAGQAAPSPSPSVAPQSGVQLPSIPPPVAVSLDAASTAFLAFDFNSSVCANLPACVATIPAVAAAITAARAANALVAYSTTTNATVLPDVLMQPTDPVVTAGADKFFNTNLDDILKQHGITTVVVAGTVTNGAVLYTSFQAAIRGYTVVVVADGVSARTDFATYGTEWQLLNGPTTSNPQNTPLQPKAVTLSRTDLISYR